MNRYRFIRCACLPFTWRGKPAGALDCRDRGHVVVLPGIGGDNALIGRWVKAIEAQIDGVSAEIWDWTTVIRKRTFLSDLRDQRMNRERAARLADALQRCREANPEARLFLAATSGGTGIALFACQCLPDDFVLEKVIFTSAALSPDADLTPILSRSRRGLFSYYSRKDTLLLGAGTKLFGTMEGKHRYGAGLVGFAPGSANGTQCRLAALQQLAWSPDMRSLGNDGGHLGGFGLGFIRDHLLPQFRLAD